MRLISSASNRPAMAFGRKFGKDITDLIFSMRDTRYEMVRAGGKTPSSSCFNVELHPLDIDAVRARPTICVENILYHTVESDSEDEEYGNLVTRRMEAGRYSSYRFGATRQVCVLVYGPAKVFDIPSQRNPPRVGMSVWSNGELAMSKVEDLFWHCEPCLPNNEVRSDA